MIQRFRDMVATRSYLTGGLGSRHRDEAFGDPYELPPDRAYAETCAAVASVMLAWRLLLATGESGLCRCRRTDDVQRRPARLSSTDGTELLLREPAAAPDLTGAAEAADDGGRTQPGERAPAARRT